MNFSHHQTLKGLMPGDIYPWLFWHRKFFPHCQLNTQIHKTKHYWLIEPVFFVTIGDTLHYFITRAILEVDNREKVSPGSTNHNWHQEKVLLFDLISKPYKSIGLYLIECLCVITSCNLLECWLYENINLVLLWISRVLGTRWQWIKVSSEKNIWKISVKRLFFLWIRHIFIAEMGKASSKSWIK